MEGRAWIAPLQQPAAACLGVGRLLTCIPVCVLAVCTVGCGEADSSPSGTTSGKESGRGVVTDAPLAPAADAAVTGSPGGESDGGDPAADSDGSDSPPLAPEVTGLSPGNLLQGEHFTIEGTDLTSGSERVGVWVGSVPATIVSASEERLVLTLPSGLTLSACEQVFDVIVTVGLRQSAPVPLTITRSPPSIHDFPMSYPAGSQLTLEGRGLGGAVVNVGVLKLAPSEASDTLVRVDLPRDLKPGSVSIAVTTECGSTQAELEVLHPIPSVSWVEPTSLAPGGVAYIRADFADRAMLRGVRIGSERIAVADAKRFAWPSYAEASTKDLFAVRVPLDLPVGPVLLTLESTSGDSAPMMIKGVKDDGAHPPSDDQIRIPPWVAASDGDGRFPIGTAKADPVIGVGDVPWCYTVETGLAGSGMRQSCGRGRMRGHEFALPARGYCGNYVNASCLPSTEAAAQLACNPFEGDYQLDGSTNWATITVRRGREQETYVGGWIARDGGPPRWLDNNTFDGLLALRSTRTGLQIVIQHAGRMPECP